jgi:hypothetical protein
MLRQQIDLGRQNGSVESRKKSFSVIPAQAGIQLYQIVPIFLDSGFHRSDDFLRHNQF